MPGAQARYHDLPEKNWASHLADGLCYGVAKLGDADLSTQDVMTLSQEPLEFSHAIGAYPTQRNGEAPRWR